MVVVTGWIVVQRYWFDSGSIAVQESVLYLHAVVIMLGAAYTLRHDGHVRVDIFYQRAGRRAKALIDLAGTLLLLLPMTVFIGWISYDYVAASWSIHESSHDAGGLPGVYLLKSTILAMAALVSLQGIAHALRAIAALRGSPAKAAAK
ncbi:MAG: TRAP transporter small permease subunit [Chromatiales bacterium]|nr:TRAP transporter small permease subunit [Chromatiales bacterium]